MMISDSAAGAPKDILLRQMAKTLERQNPGWRVVADDKVGGDGATAMSYLLAQPPNGATILIQSASYTVAMNTTLSALFKPAQFQVVARTDTGTFVLAVHPRLGVQTLPELTEYAKTHRISIAGYGQNSLEHFAAARLAKTAGFDYAWVPYGSGTQAVTAVSGGSIDATVADASAVAQYIGTGKLKGIVATSVEPVDILPTLPTVGSLGHPEDATYIWHALLVKAGTPGDVLQQLEQAVRRLPADKEFSDYLRASGVEWSFAPGADFEPELDRQLAAVKDSAGLLKPGGR